MGHKNLFSKAAFCTARLSPIRAAVGWMFAHMSFAIPVKKLRQTATLLAFYHPHPAYAVHILIVPKRAIADLGDLDESDQEFLLDLVLVVQSLVDEFNLKDTGYRLVSNGGKYQDIPQLHFHLISEG